MESGTILAARKEQSQRNKQMTPSKAPIPFLGTWKLTQCESSQPELPHPVSGITTFTQEGQALRYTNDGVWSDGRTTKVRALLKTDGSWCPITGSLLADALSLTQDGRSFEAKMRRDGVNVGTTRSIVSSDGRIMHGHWEITGPGDSVTTWKTTMERE
jgi:hypothetical protein